MSLHDDITILGKLDGKQAGHLIRHDDWNALVGVVADLAGELTPLVDAGLIARLAALESTVKSLSDSVGAIDERLKVVEASVSPLLQNYVVTLQTNKANFAVGEIGEITAKVSDLKGQPVNPRPWVDFVCTWGKLRAAPGFTSGLLGDGGNSLSVQVDAQGIAKVQLCAATARDVGANDEFQLHTMMASLTDDGQQTVADALLQAPTPSDPRARKAFTVMSREYERASTGSWATYANSAYRQYGGAHAHTDAIGSWVNHYTTVMALARPDGDPLTPDGSRGMASIQANFRDWVAAWGGFHIYDTDGLVGNLIDGYQHLVDAELETPQDGLLHRVRDDFVDKVNWGRDKQFVAVTSVLDKVNTGGFPARKEAVAQFALALTAQAASEGLSLATASGSAPQGVPVLAAHVAQAKSTQAVSSKVLAVEHVATLAQGLSNTVAGLEGRMQNTEQVGQRIEGSLRLINENVHGINVLSQTSITSAVNKIGAEISRISTRIG